MAIGQDKQESWRIFEKIYHRYDLANRIISLGVDKSWRRKVSSLIENKKKVTLLDLATGTGDLLFGILDDHPNIERAVGVDMSPNMLKVAERKSLKNNLYSRCSFRVADATRLHFKNSEWDYATIAFGIRNVHDPLKALEEFHRVLKPGGTLLVLEFSLPENFFFRWFYLFYFRYLLPLIGYLITGKLKAYRYLNSSVENFPYGQDFINMMERAQFEKCKQIVLTHGIATIYIGQTGKK